MRQKLCQKAPHFTFHHRSDLRHVTEACKNKHTHTQPELWRSSSKFTSHMNLTRLWGFIINQCHLLYLTRLVPLRSEISTREAWQSHTRGIGSKTCSYKTGTEILVKWEVLYEVLLGLCGLLGAKHQILLQIKTKESQGSLLSAGNERFTNTYRIQRQINIVF